MRRIIAYLLVFGIGGLFWAIAPKLVHHAPTTGKVNASLPERPPFNPAAIDNTIVFWQARTKSDPQGAIGLATLANLYLTRFTEQGDPDDLLRAENTARRSLAARSDGNGSASHALARSLMGQHRFQEAIPIATGMVTQSSDPTQAFYVLAECRMETGYYEGAEKLLQEVGKREEGKPDTDPYGTALRARLSEIDGKPERALSQYKKALATAEAIYEIPRPTLAWFHSRVANCLALQGKTDEAEAEYQNALTLWDHDYRAMMSLARLRLNQGDGNGALEWAEKAQNLAPSQDNVIVLADAHALTGDKTAGDAEIKSLLNAQSSLHVHGRALSLFYSDHGFLPDEAVNLAKSDYETRGDIYSADTLSWALLKAGKAAEAVQYSKVALSRGTQDALLFWHAGRVAEANGDTAKAQKLYNDALTFNPHFHPTGPADIKARLAKLPEAAK